MSAVAFVIVVLIILLGVVLIASAIRVVPEYQRLVVLRLGRAIGGARTRPRPAHSVRRSGHSH